jgi:hypothetical protein
MMAVDDSTEIFAQECADALWATDRASPELGIRIESVGLNGGKGGDGWSRWGV